MKTNISKSLQYCNTNDSKHNNQLSTELSNNNKIRTGQTFLYRENGLQSMIIELRMKDDINGKLLQKAFDHAIIRYPYLKSKMVEKDGDFYLIHNPLPFCICNTTKLHSMGSAEINYHLIDINYHNKTIYLALHHAIIDGKGIFAFIKTLIYYYCTFTYDRKLNVPDVRLADDPLLDGETLEPIEGIGADPSQAFEMPAMDSTGFILPESLDSLNKNSYYRYELSFPHDSFMKYAKENNATPTILISLFLSKALYNIYPHTQEPISCMLVTDLRAGVLHPNTYKNCTSYLSLPYKADFDKLPLNQQASIYRDMLKEHKQVDSLRREACNIKYLCDKLDEQESFEAKKNMLSQYNNLITNTYILSYVGQANFGDCERYIDSVHSYGSGTTGLTLELFSCGDSFIIDFMQSFETDLFVNAFAQVMRDVPLEIHVSDRIKYETPKDSIRSGSQKAAI